MTWDRLVFFPGTPVSSTNKTDRHNIAEILLKVTLNTITLTFTPFRFRILIHFYYSCEAGWTGQRCDTKVDNCLSLPCYNNATCLNIVNDFRCTCLPGKTIMLCLFLLYCKIYLEYADKFSLPLFVSEICLGWKGCLQLYS